MPPSATIQSGPVDPGPDTGVVVIHDRVAAAELLPTDQQGRPGTYLQQLAARTPPGEQVVIMTGGVIDTPEARRALMVATANSGFGVAELQPHGDMATLTLQRLTPDQEQLLAQAEENIRFGLSGFARTAEGHYVGATRFPVESLRGMPEGPDGYPFELNAGIAAMAQAAEPGSWIGMPTGAEVMQHQDEIRAAFQTFGFSEVQFQPQQDGSVNVWVARPDLTTGQMLVADDPSAAQAPGAAAAAVPVEVTGPGTGPIRVTVPEGPAAAQPAGPVRAPAANGPVPYPATLGDVTAAGPWLTGLARNTPAGEQVLIHLDNAQAGQYWHHIEAALTQAGFTNIQGRNPVNPFAPFTITADRTAAAQPQAPVRQPDAQPAGRPNGGVGGAASMPWQAQVDQLLPSREGRPSTYLTRVAEQIPPGTQAVFETGPDAMNRANDITAAMNAAGFNVLAGGPRAEGGPVFITVERVATQAPAGPAAPAGQRMAPATPAQPVTPPVMAPPAVTLQQALTLQQLFPSDDQLSPSQTHFHLANEVPPGGVLTIPLIGDVSGMRWHAPNIQTAMQAAGFRNVEFTTTPQGQPIVVAHRATA